MAIALTDAYLSLGGSDVSSYILGLNVPNEIEALDGTAMGATTRTMFAGLANWSLEITALQSFTAAQFDAIVWPLFIAGAAIAVAVRPTSAAKGASNPEWTGNGLITSYPPISGSIGERVEVAITIMSAGTLTRAVA